MPNSNFWHNVVAEPTHEVEPYHQPKQNDNGNHLEQLNQFKDWVLSVVRIYPEDLSTDGRIQQYHDPASKKSDKPIRVFCDMSAKGVVYGWCQNHREMGEHLNYTPERHTKLSDSQIREYKAHAEVKRQAHAETKEKKRQEIIKYVNDLPLLNKSPYISKKQIKTFETALVGDNCIVLPITDVNGEIYGMQKIFPDHSKKIYGTYTKGKHIRIDGDSSTIIVCEGYATGCTLREVTGHTVFCALSKNGLGPTVKVLKDNGVDSIIIAADNDWQKKINAGLEEANRVGESHGIPVVWPEFNGLNGSDFNDLFVLTNEDEVKRQLQQLDFNPFLDAIYSGNDLVQLQPFDFVIKDFYQIDEVNMIFAGGGVGKSLFTMIQAVSIVTGRPLIGQTISRPGPVIYFNAEDPVNTMLLRLHAILRRYNIPLEDVKDLKLISGRQSAGSRGKKLVIATLDQRRVTKGRDFDNFLKVIETIKPVAVFLDPLVKIHEGCSENSNEDIEGVMGFCSQLQDGPTRFALIAVHHIGKIATETLRGQDSVGRGASAAYDHARACWLITKPIEKETEQAFSLGFDPRFLIRLDCKKATNFSMPKESWFTKSLATFDDVKNQDGEPTTVAFIESSDFGEGARVDNKTREIEKENRQDMALKFIDTLLKENGPMSKEEIYAAMGPTQKEFWGHTYKTFRNKIVNFRDCFSEIIRGKKTYYESTN